MDKGTWERRFAELLEESLSYNPPKNSTIKELEDHGNNFANTLIEHLHMNIEGVTDTDRGRLILKTFSTFYLQIKQSFEEQSEHTKQLFSLTSTGDMVQYERQG